MPSGFTAARTSGAQVQAFFAIDSPDTFMIVRPALAPQQNMNARHAVADASRRDLFDPRSNRSIISAVRFVVNQRTSQQTNRRRAFDRNTILVDQLLD
jgi:hypothetical protein